MALAKTGLNLEALRTALMPNIASKGAPSVGTFVVSPYRTRVCIFSGSRRSQMGLPNGRRRMSSSAACVCFRLCEPGASPAPRGMYRWRSLTTTPSSSYTSATFVPYVLLSMASTTCASKAGSVRFRWVLAATAMSAAWRLGRGCLRRRLSRGLYNVLLVLLRLGGWQDNIGEAEWSIQVRCYGLLEGRQKTLHGIHAEIWRTKRAVQRLRHPPGAVAHYRQEHC